ncbi:MAG: XdhC family protein [Pyrinomonadaceae bacterium]|nr:XdhC family protein [Pyrinomonadaceae bacterium]
MKELREIIKKIESSPSEEKLLLATVVEVVGSSYRLPGAKMLIDANDNTFGMISGGCLEADILERSKELREKGKPILFLYDTTKDDDSIFSLNMGCKGVIRIFLEPINKNSTLFNTLKNLIKQRKKVSTATVVSSTNEALVGKRLFYDGDSFFGDLASEELKKELIDLFLRNQKSELKRLEQLQSEIFFEKILPPLKLVIFGAGYDAIPLAEIAHSIGWSVSIVDHRPAFANKERFPFADEIFVSRAETFSDDILRGENIACVIMTHNYEQDRVILLRALNADCFYIGLLGPRKRAEKLLEKSGINLLEKTNRLYSPVGLDIGATTPETIALSIIAEIEAVSNGRNGGFLRNRQGSIYARS